MALSKRDPLEFAGVRRAWSAAIEQAGIATLDLDLLETHDCFTIAELLQYEALGLAERGQGHRVLDEGLVAPDGKLPVNRSGGLKAKGHPIGATGVSMHALAAMQLSGDAGDMQLPIAELAGVFNMGGSAVANYASILEALVTPSRTPAVAKATSNLSTLLRQTAARLPGHVAIVRGDVEWTWA